jgi:protein SCO1
LLSASSARLLIVLLAFLTGLLVFSTIVFIVTGRSPVPATLQSAVGGSFRLTDHDGKPITDLDLKGKPFLVFFGFTHCPDICPTTLFEVSEVIRALGSEGEGVRALFVTVDPERDTPAKLKDYLSSFDSRVIGVTGDEASIKAMERTYRVYSKKVPLDGGGYNMDHTAIVYLMDKEGRFVAPFSLKRKPAEAAAELRRYL